MLISLQDTFYQALMTHNNTFGLILDIVYETMPRDNLLNSACLELFEFIKRENIKPFVLHVTEKYHDKLKDITYVDTFQDLILRYEQMQGYGAVMDSTLYSQEDETPTRRIQPNGQRWQGVKEMDAAEEEYFNTSDDEEEVDLQICYLPGRANLVQWQDNGPDATTAAVQNGSASPAVKPLVDYPDDDDEDSMDTNPEPSELKQQQTCASDRETPATAEPTTPVSSVVQAPPERLSEKRRREEEDEDELVKLSSTPKRRSSTSSSGSAGSLRGTRSMTFGSKDKGTGKGLLGSMAGNAAPKRIAINLGSTTTKPSLSDTGSPQPGTTNEGGEKGTGEENQADEGG